MNEEIERLRSIVESGRVRSADMRWIDELSKRLGVDMRGVCRCRHGYLDTAILLHKKLKENENNGKNEI